MSDNEMNNNSSQEQDDLRIFLLSSRHVMPDARQLPAHLFQMSSRTSTSFTHLHSFIMKDPDSNTSCKSVTTYWKCILLSPPPKFKQTDTPLLRSLRLLTINTLLIPSTFLLSHSLRQYLTMAPIKCK